MEKFDYIVIGAGPGGYVSAIRAAQLGLKTALIEKDSRLGGCCLNVGCIPSKALLESSELFIAAQYKFINHGIRIPNVEVDLSAMMARKETIVNILTDGIATLMKKNKVSVIRGTGRVSGAGKVIIERNDETVEIQSEAITLALGSVPIELPFMPFDDRYIVTSTEALSFESVPDSLIVVGGGAIGLELGSIWRRLGSEVIVVEMLPQIAPFADKQMAVMLQRSLKSQGFQFHLNSTVKQATTKNNKVILTFENNQGKTHTLEADKTLVSVGRKPNSGGTGLQEAGIDIDNNGCVSIDDNFQTNIKGIYAIGDLVRGPMLAHKASEEGIAVAEIVAGLTGNVNYDTIPNVIYTHPELASVGLNEQEARSKGINYKVGKCYFQGNGRALSLGEADGLVKILADAETDRLLGAHILGPHASELIAELVIVLEYEAKVGDIARAVHAHPTLSEAVKEAALAVNGRQIHG